MVLSLNSSEWEVRWRVWCVMLLYPVSPLLQQVPQQLFVSLRLPLNLASLCLTITVPPTTASVLPPGPCMCVRLCVGETSFFFFFSSWCKQSKMGLNPLFVKAADLRLQVDKICSVPNNLPSRKESHGRSTGKEQAGHGHMLFVFF